MKKNA